MFMVVSMFIMLTPLMLMMVPLFTVMRVRMLMSMIMVLTLVLFVMMFSPATHVAAITLGNLDIRLFMVRTTAVVAHDIFPVCKF